MLKIFLICLIAWYPFAMVQAQRNSYACVNGTCSRTLDMTDLQLSDTALSLMSCQAICDPKNLFWPQISGKMNVAANVQLAQIDPSQLQVEPKFSGGDAVKSLLRQATERLKDQIQSLVPRYGFLQSGGAAVKIQVNILNPNITKLEMTTKEGYELGISQSPDGTMNVVIKADNYFGARHGLETLSQTIIFDDINSEIKMLTTIDIMDSPEYPYRGLLLDTARNFISVDAIKRTIDAMAMTKLNSFHWHLTDTHSFPLVLPSHPELASLGAFTPQKIYTPMQVKDIVNYAKVRGVRVVPEFDQPAHVGEGWQKSGLVECFNYDPWSRYCVEPPCGVFNPTKAKVYDVLEELYTDMIELFDPEIFHLGGDEVDTHCWTVTNSITSWMKQRGWNLTEPDFMNLWDYFQQNTYARLQKVKKLPTILWTSKMTSHEYLHKLPKNQYIIQVWTEKNDPTLKNLLKNGYEVILSTYETLYLDCGFSSWIADGLNWCAPYKDWQKIYDYNPKHIAGEYDNQVLGAEATLWTEQVDDAVVDSRFWPRGSALGERLWSMPTTSNNDAHKRMLIHRERLVRRGIAAQALKPEWCLQNQDKCKNAV